MIEGTSLSDELIPGKKQSQEWAIAILKDVLGILNYVHSQGVIHRDIKPSNLIRRRRDGRLVLIDFGAIKQVTVSTEGIENTVAIGTPGYIPAEQLMGRPMFSSDLYSLEVVTILALTGLEPVDLPIDPASGEFVWRDHANVDAQLATILDTLVHYDFRARYQSAEEVLQILDKLPNLNLITLPTCQPCISELHSSPQTTGLVDQATIISSKPSVKSDELEKTASGDLIIVREHARRFRAKFAQSLTQINNQPVVFHVHGIGGVGKTTLLQQLQQDNADKANFVTISFDLSLGVETPLKFMIKLYESVKKQSKPGFWQQEIFPVPDPFLSLYEQYQKALHDLETQPIGGRGQVSVEQINVVKQLMKLGASAVGYLMPVSGITTPTLEKLAESSVDAGTLILSEKDRWQQLLQQHQATRRKRKLQALILDPVMQLTLAFSKGLISQANKRPIVLMLDTYEKASEEINTWIWRYLLANTDLRHYPIRLVIAGRYSLLKQEGWRRLHQNWKLIYPSALERFDERQTQTYLTHLNINHTNQVKAAYLTTKGLPYYLNWIREQQEQGVEIDFSKGSHEISQVLLQGLNVNQTKLVHLVSCCRWFDRILLRYLIDQQGESLNFQTAVDDQLDCFEWLIQRDFVKIIQYRYCLDDVARELFRLSLWQIDPDLFHRTHALLADYFESRATRLVASDNSLEYYLENPDWCTYKSEMYYHQFFSQPSEEQRQFFAQLSTSSPLNQSQVMRAAFTAIMAEADITEHPLLPYEAKEVLTSIQFGVTGSNLSREDEIPETIVYQDL